MHSLPIGNDAGAITHSPSPHELRMGIQSFVSPQVKGINRHDLNIFDNKLSKGPAGRVKTVCVSHVQAYGIYEICMETKPPLWTLASNFRDNKLHADFTEKGCPPRSYIRIPYPDKRESDG